MFSGLDESRWVPRIKKLKSVGTKHNGGTKFEWPSLQQVKDLPHDRMIKLRRFSYRADFKKLYEISFSFTGGVESEVIQANQNGYDNLSFRHLEIDQKKPVASVKVKIGDAGKHQGILGIQFDGYDGETLSGVVWTNKDGANGPWHTLPIPSREHEIIGFHGSHDGQHITSLGLIVWHPNPIQNLVAAQ